MGAASQPLPCRLSDVGDSYVEINATATGRFRQAFQSTVEQIGSTLAEPIPSTLDRNARPLRAGDCLHPLESVRAGLAEDPVDYAFCGHREIVKKPRDPRIDMDHALISFGSSLKEARQQYEARIRTGLDQEPESKWEHMFGLLGPRDRDLEAPEPVSIDMLGRSTRSRSGVGFPMQLISGEKIRRIQRR